MEDALWKNGLGWAVCSWAGLLEIVVRLCPVVCGSVMGMGKTGGSWFSSVGEAEKGKVFS